MSIMLNAVNHFFTTFGASVIVPVMIFLVAGLLGVKLKVALQSALAAGVGLTGFGWLISAFTPAVTKLIKQMVQTTGIHLPIVDLGWQTGSLAAFGSTVGLTFFIGGLLLELALFALKITRVFMPSNLWNNFGFMIWATMAYTVTHNLGLALGLATFLLLVTLLLAEIQADAWSTFYGIKNATVAAPHNIEQVVPILLLDPLWNLLGFNRVHVTPARFKARFGLLGEPTALGALLGLLIGILGNLTRLTSLSAWGQIAQFTIQLAAIMTIFPLVTQVFAGAFAPLAAAIDQRHQTSDQASTDLTDPKRWFLAIDDGVGYGETTTLMAGMLLIPLMVGVAFLLPGNRALPVVDLIALPFMIESIVALTRGNLLKILATGVVWFSLGLYAASWLGDVYTAAVAQYGTALPTGVVLITSFNLIARPLNALIFAAFISQNPVWIGLCLLLYLIGLVALRTRRPQIWAYLRKMAAQNEPAK
ncbi:PTS system galactitol-specific IIC component [Limosilactobacillus ingluviei DSM 15946]|uniref:PTS system galactitol-specific IIC component n=2 Tax=Limosilactobacillus ingluviei TaxID=148604 RepID=A0A0R1UKJ5_9LACO|nr:PTS system galactitol-specific IIC component [Limosilactobacillus ingluviei DSM 15946]